MREQSHILYDIARMLRRKRITSLSAVGAPFTAYFAAARVQETIESA